MNRRAWNVLLALVFFTSCSALAAQPAAIRKSLVRISTTSQDPNFKVPWTPGSVGGGVGAGFVISGSRIMTNAHVVSNARFLSRPRPGLTHPLPDALSRSPIDSGIPAVRPL